MSMFTIDTKEKFNPLSKDFWVKILIMTIAIWIVSFTSLADVQGGPLYAVLAALIISLLNAFLRPLLSFISMPLIVSTFGIFMLIINAIIILLTSALLRPNFMVSGFWNAFFFSIIVTLLTFLMNLPRKVKKVQDHVFGGGENQDHLRKQMNENARQNNNTASSNRFDNDPFNDNPHEKNYTDYEDVD
ncbi:MAG: phage holin family protein [Bacteroidales bacterium]|nr:phage holin family protein [Bacteroidales bacterium]